MALIRCSECGKEYSSNANMCPMCGCPTTENMKHISLGTASQKSSSESTTKLKCPRCGSDNIDLSLVNIGEFNFGQNKGKVKPAGKKVKYKGNNYNLSSNIQTTRALCKNCGKTWTVSQMTDGQKKFYKIFFVIIGIIFIIIIGSALSSSSDKNKQVDTSNNKVGNKQHQNTISDFDYTTEEDNLILERYNGSSDTLLIDTEYSIDGKTYRVQDLLSFNISTNSVKTLAVSEGISELNKSIFNGSEIIELYLPKSLTYIYDDTLSYLSQDHIDLYYGGSEEEWNAILTEYAASSFTEKLEEGDAEGAGTALADKINKMVGHDLDLSKFTLHFNSKIEDVIG